MNLPTDSIDVDAASITLDDANCIVLLLDGQGRVLSLNPFGQEFFGYRQSEIIGRHITGSIVPEKDHSGKDLAAMVSDLLEYPDKYTHQINENRCKNGQRVWVIWSNRAFRDASGRVSHLLCVGNDITDRKTVEALLEEAKSQLTAEVQEQNQQLQDVNARLREEIEHRKKAQQALEESRNRFRLLSRAPTEGILFHNNGIAIEVNDAFADLVECPRDRLIGMDVVDHFVSPEDRPRARQNIVADDIQDYELTCLSTSGRTFPVELRVRSAELAGQSCRVVTVRDISHRKKTERQLIQSQKMEAVGTLAGGIAHDFNNMLAGIQGNVEIIRHQLAPQSPYRKRLSIISQIVERGAKLTGQLLGYARGGQTEQRDIDLNQLVEETIDMFANTQRQIIIETRINPDTPTISGDRTQIEQVLLNLMINAVHAMPTGGQLFIETAPTILSSQDNRIYEIIPGPYAMLSVRDTGHGMDRDTQKQIFDPFFTTKERGQGTGLGLASTYGIVKNHKGYIEVYSEPEVGSQFNVLLPASRDTRADDAQVDAAAEQGTETLLVVDDEADFLDVGREMLTMIGYSVITAASSEQAVSQYRDHHESIDLVIMDMIMPGPSVDETIGQLREIDPSVPVLLSSGYSHDGQAVRQLMKSCQGFIQKPFRLVALSKKIRQILETAGEHS
jgi:PAS domain S-box-containing protein